MIAQIRIVGHPAHGQLVSWPVREAGIFDAGAICALLQIDVPTSPALKEFQRNLDLVRSNKDARSDWCFSSGSGPNICTEGNYILTDHDDGPAKSLISTAERPKNVGFGDHVWRVGPKEANREGVALQFEVLSEGECAKTEFSELTGCLGPTA